MSQTEADRQASNVIPPTQGTTPGEGVTFLATTTTASNHDLSTHTLLFERYITLHALDGDIWYSFGPTNATAIAKATAGGASVSAGTVAANCIKLASGQYVSVRLDKTAHRYLHLQADSGTPRLAMYPSSHKSLRQGGGV